MIDFRGFRGLQRFFAGAGAGTKESPFVPSIFFADSPNLDSFSRLRVGNPFPVFDNKNIFNTNPNQWAEDTNGVGASIAHLPNESSVALQVGTVSGEFAIRQTNRYFAYIPGKSQFIVMTGVFGSGKANVTKRIGYFDDDNGLFFEQVGTTAFNIVRRTSTSGSPVDNAVEQASWDLDKMDGTGPSGITLDFTKTQILLIDFQWLGSGRVRFGFDINGTIIYCHEINNANSLDVVYMTTPTLPLRYEIRNTGTAASSTTLKEICCQVTSEGGYTLPGFEFSESNGVVTRAITVRTPIFAVRLLDSFESKENRRIMKFVMADMYASTNDAFFEITHNHAPTSITATWSPIGGGSAAEFSTDITAITGNPQHVLLGVFVPTSTGNRATAEQADLGFINLHSFVSQSKASDNSQVFVVYATSFTGTSNVSSSMTWVEFD